MLCEVQENLSVILSTVSHFLVIFFKVFFQKLYIQMENVEGKEFVNTNVFSLSDHPAVKTN